jgi:hypothetical protein
MRAKERERAAVRNKRDKDMISILIESDVIFIDADDPDFVSQKSKTVTKS